MGYKVIFSKIKLYNTNTLQTQLGLKPFQVEDDNLLCLAYNKLGNTLPSYLDGDFSFVLYNVEREFYFCARDPLGVKALYFTKTEEGYRFSSNIDELLHSHGIQKKPNFKSMRTMLYHRTVDYTDTMYEGIYRLPPGHWMTIENGKEYIERYWYPEKIKIDYTITEDQAAEKLTELFSKAIKNRIINLEETAFEVSGGLDSSSVVSLLSQSIDPSQIDSYSMDFNSLTCNESIYIDSLLEKYSLHHQKIPTEKLDYQKAYSLDHLYTMSPNWPITLTFAMSLPMLQTIKNDGKTVIITGQGGDHLLTGTIYTLYDQFKRFRLISIYKELKLYSKPINIVKNYMMKPLLGKNFISLLKKFLRRKETNPFLQEYIYPKNLTQIIGVKNPAYKNDLDMVTSTHHTTIMDGNLFHCAEDYFDMEFRHPFFDINLVEFVLSLPPEMKFKQQTIKWILRRAMNGILPDKIRDRKDKAEFSEIITQQIDAINLNLLLDNPYIVKLGLIEQSLINKYRKEYENKTIKYISYLWTIINVEYWYRYNFKSISLIGLKLESE